MARTSQWNTDRLNLSQLGGDDTPLVREYGLRSRGFHRAWDPTRPLDFWEPAVVRRRLEFELEMARQDRALVLYLSERAAPRRIIGRVALTNILRGPSMSCVAGYGLAPDATGQGFMTEALSAAVQVAFTELDLHRVEANIMPRNTRSLAVVDRCGFRREGLSPRFLNIDGVWEDHIRTARLNPTFG